MAAPQVPLEGRPDRHSASSGRVGKPGAAVVHSPLQGRSELDPGWDIGQPAGSDSDSDLAGLDTGSGPGQQAGSDPAPHYSAEGPVHSAHRGAAPLGPNRPAGPASGPVAPRPASARTLPRPERTPGLRSTLHKEPIANDFY